MTQKALADEPNQHLVVLPDNLQPFNRARRHWGIVNNEGLGALRRPPQRAGVLLLVGAPLLELIFPRVVLVPRVRHRWAAVGGRVFHVLPHRHGARRASLLCKKVLAYVAGVPAGQSLVQHTEARPFDEVRHSLRGVPLRRIGGKEAHRESITATASRGGRAAKRTASHAARAAHCWCRVLKRLAEAVAEPRVGEAAIVLSALHQRGEAVHSANVQVLIDVPLQAGVKQRGRDAVEDAVAVHALVG